MDKRGKCKHCGKRIYRLTRSSTSVDPWRHVESGFTTCLLPNGAVHPNNRAEPE